VSGWYDGVAETVRGLGMTCPGIGCIVGGGAGNIARIHGRDARVPSGEGDDVDGRFAVLMHLNIRFSCDWSEV
jgi:hypothetical protein